MSLESLLANDTITVKSPTASSGDQGGAILEPYVTKYAGVPARVDSLSAEERLQYELVGQRISHTVYTKQSGILNGDLIITSVGEIIRVEGVSTNRGIGTLPTYYEILGAEVIN